MRRTLSVGFVLLLVAGSLAVLVLPAPPARAAGQISVYMGGLNFPIALAFSDNRTFYAERNTGSIRIIQNGTLLPTPFYTLANTATAGERGLLGLALDPGFPATPYVYAYQSYTDTVNGTVYNRVVKILANGNLGVSHVVILQMPPLSPATNHNGGVIGFGPDGKLYVVVGENANPALSQDPMSLLGKVLRLETNGSAPTDNPFYGNPLWEPRIFTYGHRNMFGLAFHPNTGRVYVTENGPNCNDEINLLAAGANFGWGPTNTCATPPPAPNNTNRDGPNPVLPIWWWAGTICPTNAAIYGGPWFPAFQGDMFMGDCNFRRLHRLHMVPPDDNIATDDIVWTAPLAIIEVEVGPDGAIWFTTPTTIYRYWDSAQPPVPAFTATPNPVAPGSPVAFDATASFDPDGTIIAYSWAFGDTSGGTGVTTSHAYSLPGTYTVTLAVLDNESFGRSITHDVVVQTPPNPQPPVASFIANPSRANPGAPIAFDASPSYDPDGTIVWYAWEFGDSTTGTGVSASHVYAAPGTYAVNLTVVDNSSLSDTVSDTVVVNRAPVAAFSYSPTTIYIAVVVTFDGSASTDDVGVVSWTWNFGDGAVGSGSTATHSYVRKGVFLATLTVTDDLGLTDATTRQVRVSNRAPRIIQSDPDLVPVQLGPEKNRSFTVLATDPDADLLTYTWRVEGVVDGGNASILVFSRPEGVYRVNVTISDGSLATWREWTVTVTAPTPGTTGVDVALPWAAGAIFLAAILLALIAAWRRRKRDEVPPVPPQAPPPPPPPPPPP